MASRSLLTIPCQLSTDNCQQGSAGNALIRGCPVYPLPEPCTTWDIPCIWPSIANYRLVTSVWSSQVQGDGASPLQSTGAAPDVGEAELADVALVWRECQHGRAARRRARTSVTSLYSSGELIQTLLCGCDVYFLLAVPVLVILNQIILLILCSWCVPGGACLLLRLTDYSATMYTRPR